MYLVKLVDVVGEQVDNLACCGLSHGWAAEAKSLEKKNHDFSLSEDKPRQLAY